MKRDLYEVLCRWKRDANRRPLLVRGARQVGKTYLMDEFGKREFIEASGEKELRNYICDHKKLQMLPESLHNKLNEHIRKYFILGGMPAVVQEYCETGDMISCQRIQRAIVETYQDDFGKYSKKLKHRYLDRIYNAVPKMVGRKFVYAYVDNTIKSRELKEALELLEKAGVVKKIKRTSGAGLPLEAGVKDAFF